jgi:uncharacterized UPF0160 family protein
MIPEFLVTHSGGFHADELMSSVVLTQLFPDARIVRSRDQAWITPRPDRIIFDVGGQYDPEIHIYDHHQRGAPVRDDENPYSSFGLVWKHFGLDYLAALGVTPDQAARVFHSVDQGFVLLIDLLDNGALDPSVAGPLSGITLPALLESLKPVFDDPDADADDHAFHRALTVARLFLEARVARSAAKLRAEAAVLEAISQAGESPILELPRGMPFRSAVAKTGADHLLFVITPRGKDWSLGGIRKHDEGFELRADLPETWAGLSNADLEAACGVTGASFCHKGRFIAAATSREAIVAMAQIAVEDVLRQNT